MLNKLKAFRIRKHNNIEILYYGIMENMEIMEICGILGKDLKRNHKGYRKKSTSRAFATRAKKCNKGDRTDKQ